MLCILENNEIRLNQIAILSWLPIHIIYEYNALFIGLNIEIISPVSIIVTKRKHKKCCGLENVSYECIIIDNIFVQYDVYR